MKQTTDTWTSMANTSIDKRYVSTSKTFFTRLSSCYKTIDNIIIKYIIITIRNVYPCLEASV